MTDPIADLLAEHTYDPFYRCCSCTTDTYSAGTITRQDHTEHLADVIRAYLTSDDMRERVADTLINQGYEPYTYALDAAGRILASITEGDQP